MARGIFALTLALMAGALGVAVWRLFLALRKRREPRRGGRGGARAR